MTAAAYGAQFSPLSGKIYAGRINKGKTEFLEKQDITGDALWAVANYALANHDGDMWVQFGDLRMEVTVTRQEKEK